MSLVSLVVIKFLLLHSTKKATAAERLERSPISERNIRRLGYNGQRSTKIGQKRIGTTLHGQMRHPSALIGVIFG